MTNQPYTSNGYAFINGNNDESYYTFIDTYGKTGKANYFTNQSPNELSDQKHLVFVSEFYRITPQLHNSTIA
jgi:hypothetical protein